jgi:serine/threonine protein kinase/photosystem II stability/assembly factor-like uncharacterized protein
LPLMIGTTLDHYRIVSKIGEGGMGIVYRAHDEMLSRDVAIKLLAKESLDMLGRDHLLAEARTASSLSHPNICTIHEVRKTGDEYYVVMELIEGRSLRDLIAAEGLPNETVLRYGFQIADALAHAHDRSVVHRDLKSSNVMITPEGRVKVLDFGLAMSLRKEQLDDVTRSLVDLGSGSELVGTLSYMAPEILRGESGSYQSDIWAVGVLLFEAAAGHLPFHGRTGLELGSAILHGQAAALPSQVPPGFTSVVQRCLTKEPALRFQRASEMRAALEALQSASIAGGERRDSHIGLRTMYFRGVEHLSVKNGDVLIMAGTNKGLFMFRSSRQRSRWQMAGPYFPGRSIYAIAYDHREGRHRIWISTSQFWGSYLQSSDDFGKSWTNPLEANVKFPQDSGASLKNIWQICLGRAEQPDVLYCGVEPAALFESHDCGESWSLVEGLFAHPHRPRWVPGNGGLCLHTIIPDPGTRERMTIAISAAGVYRTDDGGRNWQAKNHGIRVVHMPDKFPEFGQCVHKIVMHPSRPERMFLQNHWGLYRSDDAGDSWHDIAHGVPSDFGFAMVMHPHDPECAYIAPVESDEFRCTPGGKLRVYRTRNSGASWEPLTRGLPQKGAYETVLRDSLAADSLDPAGIYFGTRSGKLFHSRDEGKSWQQIKDGLPQILCVRTAMVERLGAFAAPRQVPKRAENFGKRKPAPSTRRKAKR